MSRQPGGEPEQRQGAEGGGGDDPVGDTALDDVFHADSASRHAEHQVGGQRRGPTQAQGHRRVDPDRQGRAGKDETPGRGDARRGAGVAHLAKRAERGCPACSSVAVRLR